MEEGGAEQSGAAAANSAYKVMFLEALINNVK